MGVGPPGADYRISPQTARRCVGISSQVVNGPGNGEHDSSGMCQEGEREVSDEAVEVNGCFVDDRHTEIIPGRKSRVVEFAMLESDTLSRHQRISNLV